ncbi:MAG TPA: hypothetical protein VI278_05655 [Nitrososphaeraceae archaeon]
MFNRQYGMYNMRVAFLVIGSVILTLLSNTALSSHNRFAYAHTFSQNEDTLYLTMIHQIQCQAHLVQSNFPTNVKLAQQHANLAMSLLNQNDPVVNNTTWGKEIADKDLGQLKTAIDNKAPFMDIMKLVHLQLHPTLITAYNLQVKS